MSWQFVGVVLALLLWVASFDRIYALAGRARDALHRAECVTFCGAALCLTLQIPPLQAGIGEALGVLGSGRLLANLAGIYAAWSFYPCMLDLWDHGAPQRGFLVGIWPMLATGVALVALFVLSSPIASPSPQRSATDPFTIYELPAAYTLVYMVYLGGLVLQMFRLSLRCGRRVCRSPLAPRRLCLQLHAQTIGWAAGLGFATHQCLFALLRQREQPYPLLEPGLVSNGLLVFAVVGVTSGELHAPWYWFGRYRACRRLYPLWRLLRAATPAIALSALFPPPDSALADALGFNDTGLRLRRRVVEIQDGIVALRPYRDPLIAAIAAERCRREGIGGQEREAIVEAATLVAAARAKSWQLPLERLESSVEALHHDDSGGTESETVYLQRIAIALTRSPIVTGSGQTDAAARDLMVTHHSV